jgi:acetyl esterase
MPRPHRRAIGTLLDGLFSAGFAVARLHPRSSPERHGVERIRGLSYGPRPEQLLDVWRPIDRPGPLPAVLYVHGGAFQNLSRDTHWLHGLAWARHGMVVFNIDYRLAPKHRFPAGLQDVCEAALWVQANAAEWGGDAERLALGGDSAGANLVTALTVAASWERPEPWAREVFAAGVAPKAVSAAYGVLQITDSARYFRGAKVPWLVRQRILDVEDCYLPAGDEPTELVDPLLIIEQAGPPDRPLPPFYLAAGTADPVYADTPRMAAALQGRGGTCVVGSYEGEGHGFDALVWRRAAKQCWAERYAFLDRALTQKL